MKKFLSLALVPTALWLALKVLTPSTPLFGEVKFSPFPTGDGRVGTENTPQSYKIPNSRIEIPKDAVNDYDPALAKKFEENRQPSLEENQLRG